MPEMNAPITLPPARFVTVDDCTIAYFVLGDSHGPPLMLCHGLAANGLQFVADANYFADQGYFVIVPDLRGHGRSGAPTVRTDAGFSILRMAADLIAILDAEEVIATDWVGNSLGGILALSLMATDRARLKSVTTFGTAYALNIPKIMIPLMGFSYRVMGRRLLAWLGARGTSPDKKAQAIVYAMLEKIDVDVVVRIAGHLGRYDLIANALEFNDRLLMIRAARDSAVNKANRAILPKFSDVPWFSLVDLDNAGHCANLEQPEKVRRLILDAIKA